MSYSVIVSHVLMRPNEAFAAKIGIKRSGGILIEMNQQAREHFFKFTFPGKNEWLCVQICPSDHRTVHSEKVAG